MPLARPPPKVHSVNRPPPFATIGNDRPSQNAKSSRKAASLDHPFQVPDIDPELERARRDDHAVALAGEGRLGLPALAGRKVRRSIADPEDLAYFVAFGPAAAAAGGPGAGGGTTLAGGGVLRGRQAGGGLGRLRVRSWRAGAGPSPWPCWRSPSWLAFGPCCTRKKGADRPPAPGSAQRAQIRRLIIRLSSLVPRRRRPSSWTRPSGDGHSLSSPPGHPPAGAAQISSRSRNLL